LSHRACRDVGQEKEEDGNTLKKMKVAIIQYNAGNTQSVIFALNRLGIEPILSNNKEELLAADKVILPGVGHAKAAMENLKKNGLVDFIPSLKQPVLGICLGQQLMCKHSEEGDVAGLNIFPTEVKLFPATEKVPHMGWNSIINLKSALFKGVEEGASVYHVHSYYVSNNEFAIASCNYITPFATAMQRDNFYATQFHPEKSGAVGEQILKNFLEL
jgi:glutamine amidotransferase